MTEKTVAFICIISTFLQTFRIEKRAFSFAIRLKCCSDLDKITGPTPFSKRRRMMIIVWLWVVSRQIRDRTGLHLFP